MLDFILIATFIGLAMLVLDCFEVGRNDAANLVNAVFGARVMPRHKAAMIAAVAVVLGATFAAPVMETARKGIFDPTVLTVQMAMAIYISVYFVDTVLLYAFSGFGMPVSTTACLVFELVGASLFLAGPENVNWSKVGMVAAGNVLSIVMSGVASFMMMRVFRAAIRDGTTDLARIRLHGPWVAGAMFSWLAWFMVFKGLKNVSIVKAFKAEVFDEYGEWLALLLMWVIATAVVHLVLWATYGRHGYRYLFSVVAVTGMICMAFAFGQNDLANAASPGLAAYNLWSSETDPSELANIASEIPIHMGALFICGLLMASGMFTKYAQRVTRAQVNTGSQYDEVTLYAPKWCKALAAKLLKVVGHSETLAPEAALTDTGKKIHYDTLRASVITAVSASVIAFASGRGLPVSTTYVAFAAVLGTGMSDRVFARGDASTKAGRAIWVISCWGIAPVIAILATGIVATLVYNLSIAGLFAALLLTFGARYYFKRRADVHEQTYHQ